MTPIEWLLNDDTGISSKTICAVMTGSKFSRPDIPYDGGDFGRCYRLLQHFPEWRKRMHEVAEKYPIWGPMVEAWDELSERYETAQTSIKDNGLYERMRELVDAGRVEAGWKRLSPTCWQGPDVEVVEIGGGASLKFGR